MLLARNNNTPIQPTGTKLATVAVVAHDHGSTTLLKARSGTEEEEEEEEDFA